MKLIADFHLHSPYSLACSKQLSLENIYHTAKQKGLGLMGTGDFSHPLWHRTLKQELKETKSGSGLFFLQTKDDQVRFILSNEFALIYRQADKVRKVHLQVLAPSFIAIKKLNDYLAKQTNLSANGRPIIKMSAIEFTKLVKKIDPHFIIYPAHIWTPWFSAFGANSGFNSLAECFGDQLEHINAFETGLSSDPQLNSRVSQLDALSVISSSDAHSLDSIGREATILNFAKEPSFAELFSIIKNRRREGKSAILGTIESYSELGMYHFDGHRNCNLSLNPQESKKLDYICPKCHKKLTKGVLSRIEELADRPKGYQAKDKVEFSKIIDLKKILQNIYQLKTYHSKKIAQTYLELIDKYGSEYDILLNIDTTSLKQELNTKLKLAIDNMRSGKIKLISGFDGSYGHFNLLGNRHRYV